MHGITPQMIARFPKAANRAERAGFGFLAIAERYSALPIEPLFVRAVLGTPYAPTIDGRLHLDSILSKAVVDAHPCPPPWGDEPAVIPLPISLLWASQEGLPLWACSDLYSVAEKHSTVEYWHKRFPEQAMQDWCAKPNADMGSGRYKEYRVPVRTEMPADSVLCALCIGNRDEVERLLSYVTHVGKKPSQGKGRVIRWYVEPIQNETPEISILSRRPVPLSFFIESSREISGTLSPLSAWTPPYWYRPWHAMVRLPHDSD